MKNLFARIPGAWRLAKTLGVISEQDRRRAFLLQMLPKDSVGVEIGVHKGDFSAQILHTVRPCVLHLIDPWRHEDADAYKEAWYGGKAGGQQEMDQRHRGVCERFAAEIDSGRVAVHRGFSSDVLREFPDESLDWVYIDGNHLYEFVKQDLELSFTKTKRGGYITGDDYGSGGWWQGGVKQAVDEFIAQRRVERIEIRNGQFVLRRL